MDTCNYRIIKHEDDPAWFGIHEIFYDEDGEIYAYTKAPFVEGDSVEDIKQELLNMLGDLEKFPEPINKSDIKIRALLNSQIPKKDRPNNWDTQDIIKASQTFFKSLYTNIKNSS